MNASPGNTDWLALAAAAAPASIALVEDDGTAVSYAELCGLADDVATLHRESGVAEGTVVLTPVGAVDCDLIASLWGAWRAGVVPLVVDENSPFAGEWTSRAADLAGMGGPALHTVVLTSGSGGGPRPVRLTRANVVAAVEASQKRLGNADDDRWLLTLPLFHIGGLSILWRSAAAGGTVVVHSRFNATRVAEAIQSGTVSMASFVPTMLYRLLAAEPGPYTGMKRVLLGGAAASRGLVERALDAGLPILQTYGMTETCSQTATVVPGEAVESLGTTGVPLDGVSISTGEAGVGEIVVSGPMVSPGYLGEPDRDGGHPTGDIGYLDEHGRLVVLARADDMIITGGENVYPEQVAGVLSRHPDLEQVKVVGVPDAEWGQAVVAIAIGNPEARSDILEWASQRLPRHEVPKRWAFVDELPIQPGGKVNRSALFEIAKGAE